MPDSLEELVFCLLWLRNRVWCGVTECIFKACGSLAQLLPPYVGEPVTIRYDPRDLGEVGVFHRNQFLCRAISPEHVHETVTLKDIQTARSAHRRALRSQINARVGSVAEYLPAHRSRLVCDPSRQKSTAVRNRKPKLRIYQEDT